MRSVEIATEESPQTGGRVRRSEARHRLIEAAQDLTQGRPWSSITVDDLTQASGLKRTAFYQHFADRQDLILAVLESLGAELGGVADVWIDSGLDPAAEQRRGLTALVDVFARHGRTLQAVSDAAAVDDGVRRAWAELTHSLVELAADGIRRDVAAGHSRVADPQEMAVALSALTENYLLKSFGRDPLADPVVVADTLSTIWVRTLYDVG